jgi:hypothetical protein
MQPRIQVGEYVMLTHSYLGLPAGSVGLVTKCRSGPTRCYQIYFSDSLPSGPFPETALIRVESAGARVKSVPLA